MPKRAGAEVCAITEEDGVTDADAEAGGGGVDLL